MGLPRVLAVLERRPMSQDEQTAREDRHVAIAKQILDDLSPLSKEERLGLLSSVLGLAVCDFASNRTNAAQLLGLVMKEAFDMVFENLKA